MSDDTDRLDRAERIRRMRENRGGEETDDDTEETDDNTEGAGGDTGNPGGSSEDTRSDTDIDRSEEVVSVPERGDAGSSSGVDEGESGSESDEGESGSGSGVEDSGPTNEGPEDDVDIDESDAAAIIETATGGASAGQDGGASTPGEATAGTASTQVTEDMTAAEVARIVGQHGSAQQETVSKGFGRGQSDDEIALRAGSITGETIVDDSFFEEGGRAQIIEFSIGPELFAIDVGFVGEIIETPEITRIPNTPGCVQGVVDLRGKVTAVMDPTPVLASEATLAEEALVVVLDSEAIEYDGTVGWLVDDVRQVSTISASQVTDPPEEDEWVRGVVDRDDEDFVIWADPTAVLEEVDTTGVDGEPVGGDSAEAE